MECYIEQRISEPRRPIFYAKPSSTKMSTNQNCPPIQKIEQKPPKEKEEKLSEPYENFNDTKALIKSLQTKENIENYLNENSKKFLEDFELFKYLGRGSSGIVYEGKPKCSKQKVAYKFFITSLKDAKKRENDEKIKRRNQQRFKETAILKKLHHENIINLFGHVKINDVSSCLVMGFAKYGDLNYFRTKLIKRKTLSETLLCYLTKGILDAIKFFHLQKIIHMDLKEDNILIDEQLIPKISDFSVSLSYEKFPENKKIQLPFAGTGFYVSSEVINGDPISVDECSKIDLYSLGVLLYHLSYGEYPYDLSNLYLKWGDKKEKNEFKEIAKQIKKSDLTFPKDKRSKIFENFLEGLLNKSIKKRFNIDQALNHPWVKFADKIIEEKEKIGNLEKFLVTLLSDGFIPFNHFAHI